jgi:hypothetical protein
MQHRPDDKLQLAGQHQPNRKEKDCRWPTGNQACLYKFHHDNNSGQETKPDEKPAHRPEKSKGLIVAVGLAITALMNLVRAFCDNFPPQKLFRGQRGNSRQQSSRHRVDGQPGEGLLLTVPIRLPFFKPKR